MLHNELDLRFSSSFHGLPIVGTASSPQVVWGDAPSEALSILVLRLPYMIVYMPYMVCRHPQQTFALLDLLPTLPTSNVIWPKHSGIDAGARVKSSSQEGGPRQGKHKDTLA